MGLRQRISGAYRPWHAAFAISTVAVFLRLYRRQEMWPSSDAVDLVRFVSGYVCRTGRVFDDVSHTLLYRLGGVEATVIYAHMVLLKVFGIHASELAFETTTILVSATSCFAAFLLVSELSTAAGGLAAAAILAICPMSINLGRHLGAPWAWEECLQYLLCYGVVRLMRQPTRPLRIGFNVALAVYFWTGNQMLGILPVLGFGVLAGVLEENGRARPWAFLKERVFTPWALIPLFSFADLLYCAVVLRKGHLSHALFDKRHPPGFYMADWFDDAFYNVGQLALSFSLAAVLLGLLSDRKLFTLRKLPVVLFLCYAAPFWFIIPKSATLTRGYTMYGIQALLLAATTALHQPALRALRAPVLSWVTAFLLFVGATRSSWGLSFHPIQSTRAFQGTYAPTNGVKAAALWIRERGRPKGKVFSDASGGSGLEPPVMSLYFARHYLSLYDAQSPEVPYKRFSAQWRGIQYLVAEPTNRELARQYFPMFKEALRVTAGDRGEVMLVYEKDRTEPPEELDAKKGDRAFFERYTLLCPVEE